ncbi:hypothetical protein ARMSODRAFT_1083387 [Armillaria solidipes]|uniref:Uncharacterized protein n=1 Tax=Armillaria solidipes TaxID=1076256 RepID=A0A2H3C2X4_9AGAR|nr:hypothetical protein ARMSODRAFT_1083387 [Armillaria solidipes]
METPRSEVVKALTTMSRDAENDALSYGKTLGDNGLLSEKDISDLRKNTSSLNDDLVVLDRLPSVLQYRREESWAFLTLQTALLTTLPPTSFEERRFFHCEPYNDSVLSSLPVEILIEIFQLVVAGDLGLAEYDVLDVKHSPNWVISHVCRVWRSVAVSMPSLWTSVFIEDDSDLLMIDGVPFTENKATLLQEYLTRSNQYPLRVALSSSYDIQKHHEILLPHFTRCTDLNFTVNEGAINMLFTISVEFPDLKRLSIVVDDISHYPSIPRDPRSTTSPPINGFSKAPHLQEVSLRGIRIFHLGLPFPQLLSFTGDISHCFECLILFILSSRLITATLKIDLVPPYSPLSVPFTHTNLRTLSLYTDIQCIRDLRLPALEVFRIERIRSGGYHHIAELLRESRCPLRSLYLEVPALPWSKLQPILDPCSSTLTSLSIRVDAGSARSVYDALSLDGASCLAPRLEELYVRDDTSDEDKYIELSFAEDPFLDMVFWRRDSDGEVALLKSLTMCSPYSPVPFYARWQLKALEIQGLKVEYCNYAWTKKI